MRRFVCWRPKESTSIALLYGKHALDGKCRPGNKVRGDLNPRLQVLEAVPQFLERVPLHIRALAAVAVFVLYVVELLAGSEFVKRVVHAALGHDNEFFCRRIYAILDQRRSG